ncbi:hypothetical protein Q4F19_17260 [Sphingomonas sp. BIUV-7]|uniref:Lipoprotein n=1 Tax=Sphingomonas natans TaxID=3063330 RepID=A0ABT8YCT4_9SPHN|nr:hypothetical protein [Sphingomonas sp. BIUV-7]MDO6416138.1 hypothetical protein [Sphingomonas sp. BIUV-7]
MPRKYRTATLLVPLFAASCATLPDTSGYTSATIGVRQAAAAAGELAQAQIDTAADTFRDAESQRSVRESGEAFGGAWATMLRSMDAAVAYAESLEAITHAGNSGAGSARAVADSVSTLATTLGVTIGPVAGAITDTATFLNTQIANIRASRSLARSLDAADPAIVRLQTIMSGQIAAARLTYTRAFNAERRTIEADTGLGFYFLQDVAMEREEKNQQALLDDAVLTPERSARIAPVKARLAAIRAARAGLTNGLARYQAATDNLAARRKAGLMVFAAADDAVAAWSAAHIRLSAGVRNRRPITFAALDAAADNLRQVLQTWRSL